MKKKRRKYTEEFKGEAVKLILEQGYPFRKQHGIWVFIQMYWESGSVNKRMMETMV